MIIALVGFMGTGKTTIGRLLASKLSFDFIDTDLLIEKKEGIKIATIFAEDGEEYFRSLETKLLKELVDTQDNLVLATGGGIVIRKENREILLEETIPILLQASPTAICSRVSGRERPLLDCFNLEERVEELLKERKLYYQEFANQIDTEGKRIKEIVEEIIVLLGVDNNG